jgi:hypothetical protein
LGGALDLAAQAGGFDRATEGETLRVLDQRAVRVTLVVERVALVQRVSRAVELAVVVEVVERW